MTIETPQSEMTKMVESKPEIELKPQTLVAEPEEEEEVTDVAEVETPAPVKAPRAKKAKKAKAKVAAKKAAPKAKAKPAKTSEPKSGQSGPPLDLTADLLNTNERKVMDCFALKGPREPLTIVELAKEAFPSASKKKANSWTRNSLRRLVRSVLIEKMVRGSYRITNKGRARMEKAA